MYLKIIYHLSEHWRLEHAGSLSSSFRYQQCKSAIASQLGTTASKAELVKKMLVRTKIFLHQHYKNCMSTIKLPADL